MRFGSLSSLMKLYNENGDFPKCYFTRKVTESHIKEYIEDDEFDMTHILFFAGIAIFGAVSSGFL